MNQFYHFLKLIFSTDLIAPLVLIAGYIIFLVLLKGSAPTPEQIIAHATSLYSRYGYEVIFIGSSLEALVLVSLIAPGSLVVGLGAVFAKAGYLSLPQAILVAFFGAMIGYITDYILGYIGFGRIFKKLGYGEVLNKAKVALEGSLIRTFSFGFIHANLGAVVSLAAGAAKIKFLRFLIFSGLSSFFWISLWGILIYSLGEIFLLILARYLPFVILGLVIIWLLTIMIGRRKK